MTIAQSLLGEFDHEMANTRKTLARIPDAKFAYKPHPKSMSMGDIAAHIVHMIGWAIVTVEKDNFDFAPGGKMVEMPKYKNTAELLKAFDADLPKARAAIAGVPDAAMMKEWALLNNGQVVFKMPRIATLRSMIFNHIIHHRAQLAVYLRMNDLPVPALYGPSADEK